jgi:hypothetical protein
MKKKETGFRLSLINSRIDSLHWSRAPYYLFKRHCKNLFHTAGPCTCAGMTSHPPFLSRHSSPTDSPADSPTDLNPPATTDSAAHFYRIMAASKRGATAQPSSLPSRPKKPLGGSRKRGGEVPDSEEEHQRKVTYRIKLS